MSHPASADAEFGVALRCIWPGDSFGELALLQPHNMRTATVVAGAADVVPQSRRATGSLMGASSLDSTATLQLPPSTFDDACAAGGRDRLPRVTEDEAADDGEELGVVLIRVTRELFDSAVTSLQAAQLEERLAKLTKFEVRATDSVACF